MIKRKRLLRLPFWVLGCLLLPFCSFAQTTTTNEHIFFEKPYTLQRPDLSQVTCIYKDSRHIMWFGTANGLYRYDGTNVRYFGHRNGDSTTLPDTKVQQITEDADGHLWVALLNGMARIDLTTLQCKTYTGTNKRIDVHNFTNRVCTDSSNIWIGNNVGIFKFDKSKQVFTNVWSDEIRGFQLSIYVTAIFNANKHLLIATTFHDIILFNKDDYSYKRIPIVLSLPPRDTSITCITLDSKQKLWVGTWGGGIYTYDLATNKLTHVDCLDAITHLPFFYTTSVHETVTGKERCIWITSSIGLIKCNLNPEGDISHFDLIQHDLNSEHSILAGKIEDTYLDNDGALWCAGDNGVCRCFPFQDNFKYFSGTNGTIEGIDQLKINDDTCIVTNSWNGTGSGIYINSLNGNPLYPTIDLHFTDKDNGRNISGVAKDKYGRLWISSMAGVSVLDNKLNVVKQWDKNSTGDDALTHFRTSGLAIHNDTVWIMCYHRGLDLYDLSFHKLKHLSSTDRLGLIDDVLFSFFTDSKGTLWICGDHDLYKYLPGQGRFKAYTLSHESTGCNPREMVETRTGKFIIASLNGLVQFDPMTEQYGYLPSSILEKEQRLNSVAIDRNDDIWFLTEKHLVHYKPKENRFIIFGQEDGLDVSKGLQELRTFDGNKFFLGQDHDILTFNADSLEHPVAPPYMTADMQVNDSTTYQAGKSASFILPYYSNKLQFDFTGISYIKADQNQYYYRLSGVDKQWITTYKNAVSYANLAPGNYDFRVKTINYAGMWSDEKIIHFIITPPYWQTWWFRVLAAFLIGTVLFYSTRYVVQRNLKERILRLEKETAVEKERNRIAQDMHDDMGSGLTKIAILSEVVKKQIGEPEKALEQLERISDSSRTLVDNLQDIVWMLNAKHDQLESLALYIREYATKYFEQTDISVSFDYPAQFEPIKIREEQRRNLYMSVKEALNNIAKHAEASSVNISLHTQKNVIQFTVTDNGKGFNKGSIRTFANGLKNMHSRMEQAGGTCDIDSETGKGTAVTFKIRI